MENIHTKELLEKLSNIIIENDNEPDEEGKYNDEGIKFVEVEEGDWEINYKDYANKYTVFKFTDLDVYVQLDESRSGSYYSDYFYDEPSFAFVTPVQVTTTAYNIVTIKEETK